MLIHWFSMTVFEDEQKAKKLWDIRLSPWLGKLTESDTGGRGYRKIWKGLQGSKLYVDPVTPGKGDRAHYHIELPGLACEALTPDVYRSMIQGLVSEGVRFSIKRVDFAFDDVPFTPGDFYAAVVDGKLISLAKRESLRREISPFEKRGDGEEGTETVYIGSMDSARMVRVYNRRGPVRLEMVVRDDRAHLIMLGLCGPAWSEWEGIVKGHLRQYIDFPGCDWWQLFCAFVDRAALKISSARVVSLSKMGEWFDRQLAVALSVYYDVMGEEEAALRLGQMMRTARRDRDRSRYHPVLQLA